MQGKQVFFPILLSMIVACGGGGPHADYSRCTGAPTALAIANADVLDGNEIALRKGVETDIGLQARDASGNLCDPSKAELAFSGDSWLDVVEHSDITVLKSRSDWFDLGAEPSAVMHVTLGDLHADWQLSGVLDLDGTWNVVISEHTKYPDGFHFGDVIFTQTGRHLKWSDCTITQACDKAMTIQDDQLSVMVTEVNLTFVGTVDPSRAHMGGSWSTDTYAGDWSADRK